MVAWYAPLFVVGLMNGGDGLHISTKFYYSVFRWLETVDAHCGYSFPFSPFTFIPIFGGALQHDWHHSRVFGNFGATKIWDWLCSTRAVDIQRARDLAAGKA